MAMGIGEQRQVIVSGAAVWRERASGHPRGAGEQGGVGVLDEAGDVRAVDAVDAGEGGDHAPAGGAVGDRPRGVRPGVGWRFDSLFHGRGLWGSGLGVVLGWRIGCPAGRHARAAFGALVQGASGG